MANAKNSGKKVIRRRREKKNVEKGQVHIRSSFNNTMVTVTDARGQRSVLGPPPVVWASVAARSPLPLAAQSAAETAAKPLWAWPVEDRPRSLSGEPPASVVRAPSVRCRPVGLEVTMIKDVTPIPTTDAAPKRRRV